MKNKIAPFLSMFIFCFGFVKAQVPVREEPRHHPVLQNKYIRLLDVWLPPGDTTLFHIHATPSLFIYLSNSSIGSQKKGEEWVNETTVAGKSWYRSFLHDPLIHRVCNSDTSIFHVNDIEILSAYNSSTKNKLLPFPLLFENEKAFAYQLNDHTFNKKIINNRGPIIAELVSGNEVIFHDTTGNASKQMNAGGYL